MPFRGPAAPMIKETEYEDRVERVYDAKVRKLDISDPEQRQELEDILDCVFNGWYQLHKMTEQYVPEKGTWLVMIIYAMPFNELPPSSTQAPY